jgi:hypothetical protein
LGEHLLCTEGVRSSSLLGSTTKARTLANKGPHPLPKPLRLRYSRGELDKVNRMTHRQRKT